MALVTVLCRGQITTSAQFQQTTFRFFCSPSSFSRHPTVVHSASAFFGIRNGLTYSQRSRSIMASTDSKSTERPHKRLKHAAGDKSILPQTGLVFTMDAATISSTLESITTRVNKELATIESCDVASSSASTRQLYESSFGKLNATLSFASRESTQCTLPSLVSTDAEARSASAEAKKKLQKMFDGIFCRKPLYEKLSCALESCKDTSDLSDQEKDFHSRILNRFRRNGLDLDEKSQVALAEMDSSITELAVRYEQRLNEDVGCFFPRFHFTLRSQNSVQSRPDATCRKVHEIYDSYFFGRLQRLNFQKQSSQGYQRALWMRCQSLRAKTSVAALG
eukprot:m.864957 g.864957  ORF g.864957 m.864957 type:complete len:336 (+) comp23547_c0_seq33:150-1157(+)